MISRSRRWLADIGLVYAAAVWGSTFYMVKDALEDIHPVVLVGYRFLFAAVLLGGVLAWRGMSLRRDIVPGLIIGGWLWVCYLSQTIGLLYTTASNSGFITGLFVAFVPLCAYLVSRQRPSPAGLVAVGISVIGLWVLTGGLAEVNTGDLLTIITALGCAMCLVLGDRYLKQGSSPYLLTYYQFLCVGVLSMVTAFLFHLPLGVATEGTWWRLMFLTVFPTFSAYLIYMAAQQITDALKVALIFTLEPVFAAIFAWTIGGEPFVARRAAGGVLIVCAMIVPEFPWFRARAGARVM